jgi:uncharacterized membrane protein
MKEVPASVMALMYWLHMLATVTWIGGLTSLALIVLPAARRSLDKNSYAEFLGRIQFRLNQVGWLSLLILAGTGMFQMSANSNYQGFLAIDNRWATAILLKHVTVVVMVVASAYNTWGLLPTLRRNATLRAAGKTVDAGEQKRLASREKLLLNLNLVLSVLVLGLTAWARAS